MKKKLLAGLIGITLVTSNSLGLAVSTNEKICANNFDEIELNEWKTAYKELINASTNSKYQLDMTFEEFQQNYFEAGNLNIEEYLALYYDVLNLKENRIERSSSSSSSGDAKYYYNIGDSLPEDVTPDYSKYNLKEVVEKGDIIFEANGGFGVTGHIAIVEDVYYDEDRDIEYISLIEAIDDGVVRSLLDDKRVDDKDVTILRVDDATEDNIAKAVSFCVDEIGSSYSLDLAKDTSSDESDWYCSELVWAAYYNQDIDIEKSGISQPGVTPKDIKKSSEVSEIDFSEN